MKKFAIVLAAAGLLMAGTAQASADLADKSGCNKCHAMDTKKMGPSYKDMGKKLQSAKAEEVGLQPRVTKFVLHQRQIHQRILGL